MAVHETSTINYIASSNKIFKKLDHLGVEDVIVGYSGGKDSLTILDLCVRHFGTEHVKAFFLYTLPNLECESALLHVPKERYGIKPILLPLPSMMDMVKNGYARYTSPSLQSLLDRKYGWNEVEKVVRNKTGLRWIVYGHRMTDSLQRRGMLSRCRGVWETAYANDKLIQRAYPLWEWNHKMVFSYLEKHKLPIPHMFGSGIIDTSGLSLMDADVLKYVKEHYPNDYNRLKRVFPGLDNPIHRREVLERSVKEMDE